LIVLHTGARRAPKGNTTSYRHSQSRASGPGRPRVNTGRPCLAPINPVEEKCRTVPVVLLSLKALSGKVGQLVHYGIFSLQTLPKMPLSGLCALERSGLACCGRHGVPRCAPGAGEKPMAFCRTLVLFSQKENSRNCVWVAGGLSPCGCVC